MLRRLALALLLALAPSLAWAQFAAIGPTPPNADNSNRLATTNWVLSNSGGGVTLGNTNPLMNGTAAPGTAATASRSDHVHPTDTSRAPLASPAFTGTPTIAGATSGSTGLVPAAVASGTLTLPAATDTLVGRATTDTLTNKTISGASNTITNVSLATGVTGNLPVTNLNSGTGASGTTFWRGDGTWATPAGGGSPGGSATQLQYNNTGAFGGVSGSAVSANGSLTLGGATVTASDPVLNLAQTWNAGAVVFTGMKFNVTNTASATLSSIFDFEIGGTTKLAFTTQVGAPQLNFGAATSSFPGLRANGSLLNAVLADGSAYTAFVASNLETPGGSLLNDTTLYLANNTTAQVQFGVSGDPSWRRAASNVLELNNGTAGTLTGTYFQWGGQQRVTSDFSVTSSTVLTNVTGLSVNVAAGRTYFFETELQVTDAAAGGVQAAIAGTATATAIQYTGYTIADNAIKAKTNATALATAVGSTTTTETSGIIVRITGIITVNAAGTLTVQMAQNTSNAAATTAKRGSWFIVYDMP